MPLVIVSNPVSEPVSLAEAKRHCRVDDDITEDDALIDGLISGAREQAEHIIGMALMPQTWDRVLDEFPSAEIELGMPPVTGIVSVEYVDTSGIRQVMPSNGYVLDAGTPPGWLLPSAGSEWPQTAEFANAVRVRFTCGFASASSVPSSIKAWILLHVAEWYDSREAGSDKPRVLLPHTERLLDRWRSWLAA